jgi:hypothetical protein
VCSFAIVEPLDVIEDIGLGVFSRLVLGAVAAIARQYCLEDQRTMNR